MKTDEQGSPYVDRWSYTGPDRHLKSAVVIDKNYRLPDPDGLIYDAAINCTEHPHTCPYDRNALNPVGDDTRLYIEYTGDKRGFKWRRSHGSGVTSYSFDVWYMKLRRVPVN